MPKPSKRNSISDYNNYFREKNVNCYFNKAIDNYDSSQTAIRSALKAHYLNPKDSGVANLIQNIKTKYNISDCSNIQHLLNSDTNFKTLYCGK